MSKRVVAVAIVVLASSCHGTADQPGDASTPGCYPAPSRKASTATDIDWKCDGSINWHACNSYTYDAQGNVLTSRSGCDNEPICLAFTYDATGRVVGETWDDDCDGVIDRCMKYSDGSDPRHRKFTVDKYCDGLIDDCMSEAFDECGNLVQYLVDFDCDGVPEECKTMAYSRDSITTTAGCTDIPDYCATSYVDESGWTTRSDYDKYCDGIVENSTCYQDKGAGTGGSGGTGGVGGTGSGGTGAAGAGGSANGGAAGSVGGAGGISGQGGAAGQAGAGGSLSCTAIADRCPGMQVLLIGKGAEPRIGNLDSTASGTCPDYEGSCSSPGTAEAVYWFQSDVDGEMSIGVQSESGTWIPRVYARTTCDDPTTELVCATYSPSTPVPVHAGTVYYVMVEGPAAEEPYSVGIKIVPQ